MNRRSIIPLLLLLLVAAGCSSDEGFAAPPATLTTTTPSSTPSTTAPDTTTSTIEEGFPVIVEAPNGEVSINERPERIVSLSPTSTEVLFAIGAGPQVVAVDSLSTYPTSAPVTDLSAFTPNLEAIVGFDPDLVFISYDPNGDLVPGLGSLDIPVIVHGTAVDLADAYTQWEQTGVATGHGAEAASVIGETQASIGAAIGSVPDGASALTYYYELEPSLYSITSATFIGELIGATGIGNIADGADPDGFGYPQLSNEHIIASNPSLVILADTKCCDQSSSTVADRPGWDEMTAVAQGHILEIDDDIASRWGPRIAVLVDDIVAAIAQTTLAAP